MILETTREKYRLAYERAVAAKKYQDTQRARQQKGIDSSDGAFWERQTCNSNMEESGANMCPVYHVECRRVKGIEVVKHDKRTGKAKKVLERCPVVVFRENSRRLSGDSSVGEIRGHDIVDEI